MCIRIACPRSIADNTLHMSYTLPCLCVHVVRICICVHPHLSDDKEEEEMEKEEVKPKQTKGRRVQRGKKSRKPMAHQETEEDDDIVLGDEQDQRDLSQNDNLAANFRRRANGQCFRSVLHCSM